MPPGAPPGEDAHGETQGGTLPTVPTWIKVALLALLLAALFVGLPVLQWVVDRRIDFAYVSAGGLVAMGIALLRTQRRRRERDRLTGQENRAL